MRVELNSIAYTINQLSLMHTYIVGTKSNFYLDGQGSKLKGGSHQPHQCSISVWRKGGDKRLFNPQQQDRHLELRMFYHYAEWLATIR